MAGQSDAPVKLENAPSENHNPQQSKFQKDPQKEDDVARCSEHGKRRTMPNMLPDGNGGWKCRPSSKCTGTPGSTGRVVFCSIHGKKRTLQHVISDGNGNFKCRPEDQCIGAEKRHWNKPPRWGWYPGMQTIQRGIVRLAPKPDLSFRSNTVIAIDFDFVYGMSRRATDNNAQTQTMPFPVAGTILFWNANDKVILFQGRIAVPEGIEVVDNSPIRDRADLSPPWLGTSLDSIQMLLSIYGRSAWSSMDGAMIVGHFAQYFLQSLNVEWPSSLVFDISQNYQGEHQDQPVKLEHAYLESVRPVLPGDPLDPLVRCRMGVELYLFLKEQNITQQNITQQNIAQQNIAQQNIVQQNIMQQNIMQQNIAQQNITITQQSITSPIQPYINIENSSINPSISIPFQPQPQTSFQVTAPPPQHIKNEHPSWHAP